MNLYRKYSPKTFDDILGQKIPIKILKHLVRNPDSHHAILLTGIHGIGKTALSRIFAKSLNCLNKTEEKDICEECANCKIENSIDIMEIDGATYTGVDNVRQIIEDASYLPVQLTYKVYLIDEIHMISKNAFNSLLKTIEEPPPHVKFVFATTEKWKVPDTILSRCLIVPLIKISKELIKNGLLNISEKEGVHIDPVIIEEISNVANGSMRDALSLLELAIRLKEHNLKEFLAYIKVISDEEILQIFHLILCGNSQEALKRWSLMESAGYDAKNFINKMLEITHEIFLVKTYKNKNESIENLLEKYDISNGLIVGFQEILLTQLEGLFNGAQFVVENSIMMMTIMDEKIDLSKFVRRSFNLKI